MQQFLVLLGPQGGELALELGKFEPFLPDLHNLLNIFSLQIFARQKCLGEFQRLRKLGLQTQQLVRRGCL